MIDNNIINYEYYTNQFSGALIPSNSFDEKRNKAVEYFNYKVGNNTVDIDLTKDKDVYRDCICALSERIYEIENTYASEGLGNWSVSYNDYANDPKLRQTFLSYVGFTGVASTWL